MVQKSGAMGPAAACPFVSPSLPCFAGEANNNVLRLDLSVIPGRASNASEGEGIQEPQQNKRRKKCAALLDRP